MDESGLPAAVNPADVHELQGWFAPVRDERDADDAITVTGRVPEDLRGVYLRNGPNPYYPPLGNYTFPFDGDAMVHGLWFDGGTVRYRNRFVWTDELRLERETGRALFGGLLSGYVPVAGEVPAEWVGKRKTTPFINVIKHAGRMFACAESQQWWELDDELATVGPVLFDESMLRLTGHPKVDPVTNELFVFRYGFEPPYLYWGVIGGDGAVAETFRPVDVVDVPLMVHDFVITERFLVFVLAPLLFDPTNSLGFGPIAWQPARGTKIAVVPRPGVDAAVRVFEAEPFWVWHFANAFDQGDQIVIDTHRLDDIFATARGAVHLARITLDLAAGTVAIDQRDDRPCEFPRIDDRLLGRPHDWFVMAADSGESPFGNDAYDLLWRVDAATGSIVERRLGEEGVAESIIAPRMGGDGGYVLSYLYSQNRDTTDLLVLDADDVAGDEIARIHLPFRVPLGLHGNWIPT